MWEPRSRGLRAGQQRRCVELPDCGLGRGLTGAWAAGVPVTADPKVPVPTTSIPKRTVPDVPETYRRPARPGKSHQDRSRTFGGTARAPWRRLSVGGATRAATEARLGAGTAPTSVRNPRRGRPHAPRGR